MRNSVGGISKRIRIGIIVKPSNLILLYEDSSGGAEELGKGGGLRAEGSEGEEESDMGDKLLGYGVEPEGGWSGGRSRGGMGGTEEYDGVMMTTQKGWAQHTLDDLLDWLVGGNSHVASMYRPEIVSVAGGVTPPPGVGVV